MIIFLIVYLIGCFIVYKYPTQIMKLGFKTMKQPYQDDYKSFFINDDPDDKTPDYVYMIMAILLSWIFVMMIYLITILLISQNRKK